MNEFLKRVISEREDLDNKLVKLKRFIGNDIFKRLTIEEQVMLTEQCKTMEQYLSILDKRINYYRSKGA